MFGDDDLRAMEGEAGEAWVWPPAAVEAFQTAAAHPDGALRIKAGLDGVMAVCGADLFRYLLERWLIVRGATLEDEGRVLVLKNTDGIAFPLRLDTDLLRLVVLDQLPADVRVVGSHTETATGEVTA